jgi:hypothetical protein
MVIFGRAALRGGIFGEWMEEPVVWRGEAPKSRQESGI